MSLVHGLVLDPPTHKGVLLLIDRLPDPAVVDYAHAAPAYAAGGFRKGRPAAIRARIRQQVESAEELDAPLRRLLAAHSLNAAVVAPLSTAFQADHLAALAALFGAVDLRIARLLDDRDEVRNQEAAAAAPCGGGAGDEADEAAAADRLRPHLAAFHERLQALGEAVAAAAGRAGDEAAPGRAVGDDGHAVWEERLRQVRAELRRYKGLAEGRGRLERQLALRDEALLTTREALVRAEDEARQWRQRALQSAAELGRRAEQTEAQVRRLVETRLAREFAGWLGGERAAIAAEAARPAAPAGEDPLARRAAEALAAQAQADRASGTRAQLRERLDRLEALRAAADDALGHAMRPQAALRTAAVELREECLRLRQLLGLEPPGLPVDGLAAAINGSPAERLDDWRVALAGLREAGVLDAAAGAALDETWRRRRAMLELERAPAPELRDEDLGTPAGQLQAVLRGQRSGVLLLDGHNVLFALQARYRRPQDHVYPDGRVRECLVGDLVRLAANRPTCRVRVVFDGPERNERMASANVGVVYSGGTGEHRADKVLEEEVRYFRQTPADVVLVATNDGELRGEALRLGALTLAPTELIPFLG